MGGNINRPFAWNKTCVCAERDCVRITNRSILNIAVVRVRDGALLSCSTRVSRVVSDVSSETFAACAIQKVGFREKITRWTIRRDAELNPRDAGATATSSQPLLPSTRLKSRIDESLTPCRK